MFVRGDVVQVAAPSGAGAPGEHTRAVAYLTLVAPNKFSMRSRKLVDTASDRGVWDLDGPAVREPQGRLGPSLR